MSVVAFQGAPGAFSEAAARRYFGDSARPLPCHDFAAVADAVRSGRAEHGVLPVENSIAGRVAAACEALDRHALEVVGAVVLPIRHCVLGVPGAELGRLTRVLSHPVALAQCTRFLAAWPGVQAVAVYDTAGAAKQVAAAGERAHAAIAGRHVAELYGLAVLAEGVEDRPDNQTRFVVVSAAAGSVRRTTSRAAKKS